MGIWGLHREGFVLCLVGDGTTGVLWTGPRRDLPQVFTGSLWPHVEVRLWEGAMGSGIKESGRGCSDGPSRTGWRLGQGGAVQGEKWVTQNPF